MTHPTKQLIGLLLIIGMSILLSGCITPQEHHRRECVRGELPSCECQ